MAAVTCWLFVLYPELILTGGAQMREPFLLTFIAMSLCGSADRLKHGESHNCIWMRSGFVGKADGLTGDRIGNLGHLCRLGLFAWRI